MARENRFAKIDKVLPITMKGKGKKKTRRIATEKTVKDTLAESMAECQRPSDLAMLASKFGFTDEDINQWAKEAPNFGMFRMRIGNRLRGVIARIAKAKKRNITLSPKDAAYPKKSKVKTKAKKKSVKKTTKKTTKKSSKKKKKRTDRVD
ncbi:hypothetical protein LCGC14_1662270 [marine sediment metagenome]|uniref:Uncharacterized protein n=1 Tax=marine sediment metagenome TaxID=412755 RepID=A0A0F9HUD4_9ZZZZ